MYKTLSFISSDFPHLHLKCEFQHAGSRKFVPTLEPINEINVLSNEFLAVMNVIDLPHNFLSDLELFNLPANVLTGEIAKGFKEIFLFIGKFNLQFKCVSAYFFKTDQRCDLNLYKVSKDEVFERTILNAILSDLVFSLDINTPKLGFDDLVKLRKDLEMYSNKPDIENYRYFYDCFMIDYFRYRLYQVCN